MNHRSLVLFVSLLAAGSVGLRAQTAPPEPAPAAPSSAWVITPALTSQYMFRGVRLGGPSFQPAVEFDAGGLAAGVWANFPLQDKVAGQSDPEFDFYASYVIEAVKDTLTWQPGVTFYIYPNAEKKNGFYPTSLEPNLALNYTVSGVKFTPKLYYDVVLKGPPTNSRPPMPCHWRPPARNSFSPAPSARSGGRTRSRTPRRRPGIGATTGGWAWRRRSKSTLGPGSRWAGPTPRAQKTTCRSVRARRL